MKLQNFIIIFIMLFIVTVNLSSQQWEPFNNGITDNVITHLSSNTVKIFAVSRNKIIYESDVNTNSWKIVINDIDTSNPGILSLDANSKNVLVGTSYALYISTNNGGIWQEINDKYINGYTAISCLKSYSNIIQYYTFGAIFKSTNYGLNWDLIASGGKYSRITCATYNDKFSYIGGYDGQLLFSNDQGNSWDSIYTLPASIQSLAMDNQIIIAATDKGMYLSDDNGSSWSTINNGLTNLDVKSVIITGKYIFAGTSGGIFIADNASNIKWNLFNNGLNNTNISCLSLSGNSLFAGTYGGGIYKLDLSLVSVEEHETVDLSINPNPASNFIEISLSENRNFSESMKINILNVYGQIVLTYADGEQRIDVSGLASGLYFVRIGDKFFKL